MAHQAPLPIKFSRQEYWSGLQGLNVFSQNRHPDAGKDWRQEEKEVTEDEMVGWHHWLNWHESEQTPGVVKDRKSGHAIVHGVSKSLTQLSDWTITNKCLRLAGNAVSVATTFAVQKLRQYRNKCPCLFSNKTLFTKPNNGVFSKHSA